MRCPGAKQTSGDETYGDEKNVGNTMRLRHFDHSVAKQKIKGHYRRLVTPFWYFSPPFTKHTFNNFECSTFFFAPTWVVTGSRRPSPASSLCFVQLFENARAFARNMSFTMRHAMSSHAWIDSKNLAVRFSTPCVFFFFGHVPFFY